jgi:ribonuclease E
VAPNLAERLERWADDKDLFTAYRIDEQLTKALDRKVWLPSGGSLVIDTTEAMTVIDVNTGKFTGQGGNLEQTVTRNNLEAAEEIVRQLRLRDIGGIIVIDFIDMVLESNRDLVLRRLIECLARDRTKHQVAEVTSLGLVQMTRKRVGSGLLAAFSVPCEHCNGRGVLVSTELTELPQVRNGHAGAPKPGASRSRSRSKAIAQVAAAKVAEPEVSASEGDGEESSDAAASAEVSPGQSGAGKKAATAPAATETAATESTGTGAAPRRRPRRSAHREAGPPDSARTPQDAPGVADGAAAAAQDGPVSASPRSDSTGPDSTGPDSTGPDSTGPESTPAAGTAEANGAAPAAAADPGGAPSQAQADTAAPSADANGEAPAQPAADNAEAAPAAGADETDGGGAQADAVAAAGPESDADAAEPEASRPATSE